MPEKRDNIDAALQSKGFQKLKNKDHFRYNLKVGGKISHIGTKISTGSKHKTVGDNLLIQMYKQLRMNNKEDLRKYIKCSYSYEDYIKYLIETDQI
jgi:hypothetical protein